MNGNDKPGKSVADVITLGLAGVGRWGACYLSTLKQMEGVNLGLVVSRNPATRDKIPRGCEMVEDWRAALEPGRLDGLIIATPPDVQFDMARACIDAGLPVLAEKPLALNLQQAIELAQAARERNTLVMVDHTHIFSSAYEALKHRAAGLEGPLRILSAAGNHGPFRKWANALWDWGPHDLAMCIDLAGDSPESVYAGISVERPPAEGGGMMIDVQMLFANGTEAEIRFGNLMSEKKRVFEVRSKSGRLVYDDLATDKLVEYGRDGIRKRIEISSTPPLTRAVRAFRDTIVAGRTRHDSLSLGVRVVETLTRIEPELNAGAGPENTGAPRRQSQHGWSKP